MKPQKCPFLIKCQSNPPEGIDCEKNYIECQYYAAMSAYMIVPLPTVCPLEKYCQHASHHSHCWITPEDQWDYRDCTHFSEWFWNLKAKGK